MRNLKTNKILSHTVLCGILTAGSLMSDLNNRLEGTKILSLADGSGRTHEFISETEQEKAGFKLKYYMWLSRLFIFLPLFRF